MTHPQTKVKCLPTYIVIDISGSMAPVQDVLNENIESLCSELVAAPAISDFAHISIIAFGTDAEVVLEMTDIRQLTKLPELECGGVTNFNRAFELVRACIDRDVQLLRDSGRLVVRPAVFLLTDGQPTDENGYASEQWRAGYAALVDPNWGRHPNVVPFGFGDAPIEVIREMATNPDAAYLAKDPHRADALRTIFTTLLRTLVTSAQSSALQLPAEIDGLKAINPDVD